MREYGNNPKILITGNCTSVPLAWMLEAFLPKSQIDALQYPTNMEDFHLTLTSHLLDKQIWIRQYNPNLESTDFDGIEIIDIPMLNFAGFHPDVVYATNADGGLLSWISDYHSAIALWA